MKIAQFQTRVYATEEENLEEVQKNLEEIQGEQVDLVMLGEMFCCPYVMRDFPLYAEPEGGPLWQSLSDLAQQYGVYLVCGSVPEQEGQKIYNTCYIFDRTGQQLAKHRKVHLFDAPLSDKLCCQESETITAGDHATVFETEFGRVGVCICFDVRFQELFSEMVAAGVKIILIPADFNMTTGPAHWKLLLRSRAVDYQCYVFGTSVARDSTLSYVAYGHSMAVSPWGDVLGELQEEPGILLQEIALDDVDEVRKKLPILSDR